METCPSQPEIPIPTPITIHPVDFTNPAHAKAYVAMLDAYARDPLGDGAPLPPEVRETLAQRLREIPTALAWLAWADDEPVGVLTAFVGFSTFKARPLVNIHDVATLASHRGQGIARRLLEAVEAHARTLDCCALTLEVSGANPAAQHLYGSFGFQGGRVLDEPAAMAFWKKPLDERRNGTGSLS